jgi:hypothetical protein
MSQAAQETTPGPGPILPPFGGRLPKRPYSSPAFPERSLAALRVAFEDQRGHRGEGPPVDAGERSVTLGRHSSFKDSARSNSPPLSACARRGL